MTLASLVVLAAVVAQAPARQAALPRVNPPMPADAGRMARTPEPAIRHETGVAAEEGPADVAVVCPYAFRQAFEPWLQYRRDQGRRPLIIVGELPAEEIKAQIAAAYRANPQLSVVIVGDAEPAAEYDKLVRTRSVPTHQAEAKVNVRFGSEPEIATDNWYGDFDDDGIPEIAVGRLPVDTRIELARLVRRIIDYENSPDFGPWRRRINFVAGVGNFGAIADAALENATKTLLTRFLPPAYESTMTYAGWQSPYCPGPALFQQCAVGRFNEGCLMWVYLGHGQRTELDRIYAPEGAYPILARQDIGTLKAAKQPPLAVFLACYTGAYDGYEDCLAEEMVCAEGGPIAALCGSRVTMPYAMSLLGQELMGSYFQEREATLGGLLCKSKQSLMRRPRNTTEARQFDALAKLLMPMAADLDAQRHEHLHLFNLLGDPLLRLPHPPAVKLSAPSAATAGRQVTISGATPVAGRATIEFVVRRDRLTFSPPERDDYDPTPNGLREFASTYLQANDGRLASETVDLEEGPFSITLAVPEEARGECHVRLFVEGTSACALGSADVRVSAP